MKCLRKDCLRNDILAVFLLAFTLRLGFAMLSNGLFSPETWEYENIAVNLYQGRGFLINFIETPYYAYSTPLYPILCALVYKLIGHHQYAVVILQITISSFMCIVVYSAAKRVFGKKTAILSSLFTAIHPGIIILTSQKLHAFALDAFLITLTVFLFILALEKLTLKKAALCGIIYGLCALTRSTIIPFLPVAAAMLLISQTKNQFNVKLIKHLLIMAICGFAVIAIWSTRNFLTFKRIIPITTVSTEVFWRGNNPNASGTCFTPEGETVLMRNPEFFSKIKKMNELQRYDFFKSEARDFIKNNPTKFIYLTLKKFCYFWWFSPDSGKFYPKKPFQVYKYVYFFILLLFILGAYAGLSCKKKDTFIKVLLMLSALFVISFTQSLFYVEGRHRLAIEPLMLIFAANGLFFINGIIKRCLKTKT